MSALQSVAGIYGTIEIVVILLLFTKLTTSL